MEEVIKMYTTVIEKDNNSYHQDSFYFTKNYTFAIIKLGVKYGLQYQNK